ncbi:MAG: hypothetical protein K6E78_04495 [Treponema sp.]|nr:hypothetical protein [Treponema sp.]
MTLEEAKNYIDNVRWQYAKTYVTAPHEYTVLDWKPETKEQMIDFANFILENGYKEQFYSKTYTVLQIGEYKYWSMDFPTLNTNLINRTFIDEARKARLVNFVQSPDFKHVYKMSLEDVEKQMRDKKAKDEQALLENLRVEDVWKEDHSWENQILSRWHGACFTNIYFKEGLYEVKIFLDCGTIDMAKWKSFTSLEEAKAFAEKEMLRLDAY